MKINVGNDLYLKGRIGWKGLSKDEYLNTSDYRIINGYSLKEGFIDWDIAGYISKERYMESPEIQLEIGDILISKDGTIGKVGIVRELLSLSTVASGIFVLRNTIPHKLCTEYLFQYLNSNNFKNFINRVKADGSTIQHLYQRDLVRLEIEVPDLQIQEKIAKVLSDIDSKIELNNKINAELESMAKLIYDYWFVQFDFPDKNGNPYKSSGGKMVYNEELQKEIPVVFEVKTISSFVKLASGYSFKSQDYLETGSQKIITIKNVQDGYLDLTKTNFIDKIPDGIPTYCVLEIGDILISLTGNVGRMCRVFQDNCLLNQRVGKFSGDKNYFNYVYLLLSRPEERVNLEKISSGSAQKNLSPVNAMKRKMVIPSYPLLSIFNEYVTPIFDKQLANNIENQKLSELRDWLLPMLMNGQVTIKD